MRTFAGARGYRRVLVELSLQQGDLVGAPVQTGIFRHIASAAVASTSLTNRTLNAESREASKEPMSTGWPTDAAMGLACLESVGVVIARVADSPG